ncbi:hypothetical protein AB6D11_02555 [Vibrio splendidus]
MATSTKQMLYRLHDGHFHVLKLSAKVSEANMPPQDESTFRPMTGCSSNNVRGIQTCRKTLIEWGALTSKGVITPLGRFLMGYWSQKHEDSRKRFTQRASNARH